MVGRVYIRSFIPSFILTGAAEDSNKAEVVLTTGETDLSITTNVIGAFTVERSEGNNNGANPVFAAKKTKVRHLFQCTN